MKEGGKSAQTTENTRGDFSGVSKRALENARREWQRWPGALGRAREARRGSTGDFERAGGPLQRLIRRGSWLEEDAVLPGCAHGAGLELASWLPTATSILPAVSIAVARGGITDQNSVAGIGGLR